MILHFHLNMNLENCIRECSFWTKYRVYIIVANNVHPILASFHIPIAVVIIVVVRVVVVLVVLVVVLVVLVVVVVVLLSAKCQRHGTAVLLSGK